VKVKELIKLIETDGWYMVAQKGSHRQYKHDSKPGRVTIPDHGQNKDVAKGTENSVLKQADLK
jgi:predicted RNA binding protein YcfA (HicA-like mRNA interferase family)